MQTDDDRVAIGGDAAMLPNSAALGEAVAGSRSRANTRAKVSAVIGRPSEKRRPPRSGNRHKRPSPETLQPRASPASASPRPFIRVSPSN